MTLRLLRHSLTFATALERHSGYGKLFMWFELWKIIIFGAPRSVKGTDSDQTVAIIIWQIFKPR